MQFGFYSAITAMSILSLIVLCVLVTENGRFTRDTKMRFHLTYCTMMLAMAAEWAAIFLNHGPDWTIGLHACIKSLDYILSPVAAFMLIRLIPKVVQKNHPLLILIGINTVLQIASIFTGWMFFIDETNTYRHGPLYLIYAAVYIVTVIMVLFHLMTYSSNFSRTNRVSLLLIMLLVSFGIGIQEFGGGSIRTCSLALAFGSILQFIHFAELWQQRVDENLLRQQRQLETDPLTGLFNRYAFNETLLEYNSKEIEEDFIVISIDVNGLKRVNDNLGHEAGDELLRGAAECIDKVMSPHGKCFRTGGDEFLCLLHTDRQKAEELQAALRHETQKWHGRLVEALSLSIGSASFADCPGLSAEKLVTLADREMYGDKDAYYLQTGLPRR